MARAPSREFRKPLRSPAFLLLRACAGGAAILLGALSSGCVYIWNLGPGGVYPTLGYSDVIFPNELARDTAPTLPYDPEVIEIVGWVETERASSTFGGRVPGVFSGDVLGIRESDYGEGLKFLTESHDLDGLLNKTVDTKRWVLDLYFIRFYRMHTELGGVGYRFRNRVPLFPEAEEPDDIPIEELNSRAGPFNR